MESDADSPTIIGRTLVPQPHGGAIGPWPKGVSGNPRGRPPRPITYLFRRLENKKEARALVDDYLALCHSKDERVRLEALRDLFNRLTRDKGGGGLSDRLVREVIAREYNFDPQQLDGPV